MLTCSKTKMRFFFEIIQLDEIPPSLRPRFGRYGRAIFLVVLTTETQLVQSSHHLKGNDLNAVVTNGRIK